MTDAFSKFSVAVVMSKQQVKTVAKALVDKWFYTYNIPSRIYNYQSKHLIRGSLSNCAKFMV